MDSRSKYRQVEQIIRQGIEEGRYASDDKLPSIRTLCTELDVGKNTVIRAYQELEAQGVIYTQQRSGYRVSAKTTPPVPTQRPTQVDLLSACKEILTYTPSQERLITGSAHPFIDTPAIKSLYAEIGRHSRRQAHIPSHYQLPPGNDLLIRQLAKISHDLGVDARGESLSVTHGAQQAISLALRALTQPGDIVAVESPCYFGNLLLMESLGLKVVEVPSCPRDGIDPNALEQALERWDIKAILVTPNFTNPTGACMPLAARSRLLEVSGAVPIIEDDVFGALAYDQSITPLKTLDKDNRVIYVNSLSKMLDSRLRIGWIMAGQYQAQIERYLMSDNMGSLNLMQSAVAEFLTTGKYRSHVQKMRRLYQHNTKLFITQLDLALQRYPTLSGRYSLHQPQGSFLVWLTLPDHCDSQTIYQHAKPRGISLLPGSLFATGTQFQHSMRFSCANLTTTADWKQGIEDLASLIAQSSH